MKLPKRAYTVAWVVLGLLAAALEVTAALDNQPGGTLTELLRPLVAIHPAVWWTSLGATLGLMVWSLRHIFGRRR